MFHAALLAGIAALTLQQTPPATDAAAPTAAQTTTQDATMTPPADATATNPAAATAPAQAADPVAERDARLVAGRTVSDPDGVELGKVKSVDGDNVVVTTADGDASMPKTGFAAAPTGDGLVAGIKAADLKAELAKSKPKGKAKSKR